jgi:uncharacterized protein YecE (DUF72 family)
MRLGVGTSGYSYAAWKGPFYPKDLSGRDMLRFYAGRLGAVEINNTFYRLPKPSVLEGWAEQVPAEFRFVLKASRRITHLKRLKEVGDETRYLLETSGALGDRLGAILFQLPPNLKCDLPRLDAFLELLPAGTRAAFEFRHESWRGDELLARLRARDFALVAADGDEAPAEIVPTAGWGYLRLRRTDYPRADLAAWAARVAAQSWSEAFVFFKHEDAGTGPRWAAEFLELAGRSAERRPAKAAASAKPAPRRRRASSE